MYQLDKPEPKYTWKDEWCLPYESLYGRVEKFRKINVLEPRNLDNIIYIGPESIYAMFSEKTLIYRKQNYKIHTRTNIFEIDTKPFRNFMSLSGIFNIRFRYCPVCMRIGYHSFLHQLTYIDTCFVHKKVPLRYRCACKETYVLRRRKSNLELFQCEFCGMKIKYTPDISDGITKLWQNNKIIKSLNYRIDYKNVNILDFSLSCQIKNNRVGKQTYFTELQRRVLTEITLTGRTWQKPRLATVYQSNEDRRKIIMSNLLNQYMSDNYDEEMILKHFFHISDRFSQFYIDDYDVKLLTIFFILRELQCKNNIDELNYGYGLYQYDGKLKVFPNDDYNSDIIRFLELAFFRINKKIDECTDIYNLMLKELVVERFRHIYNCFMYNEPEKYPCRSSSIVSYDNWIYPVYILVVTNNNILLY